MNNTKWEEIREAMLRLDDLSPQWRTKCTTNGYISEYDGEWHYHFNIGGYKDIEWLEVLVESKTQRDKVRFALQTVHVPGIETDTGFRVYGYVSDGASVEWL